MSLTSCVSVALASADPTTYLVIANYYVTEAGRVAFRNGVCKDLEIASALTRQSIFKSEFIDPWNTDVPINAGLQENGGGLSRGNGQSG
jgi:hypothetical protein